MIELFLSDLLFLLLVLKVVIVLDDLLAVLPELLHKLGDEISPTLDLHLLLLKITQQRYLLVLDLELFLLIKVLLAGADHLLAVVLLILALAVEVIGHPLHLAEHVVPMGLALVLRLERGDLLADLLADPGELIDLPLPDLVDLFESELERSAGGVPFYFSCSKMSFSMLSLPFCEALRSRFLRITSLGSFSWISSFFTRR